MFLFGCGVMRTLGIARTPDVEQRQGPAGTRIAPVVLNTFEKTILVLAADECRTFKVRVPQGWYLKYVVTVVNRRDGKQAYLRSRFVPEGAGWAEFVPHPLKHQFFLREGSSQAVIAVANQTASRDILFELCQEGPPVQVILQPETSRVIHSVVLPEPMKTPTEIP